MKEQSTKSGPVKPAQGKGKQHRNHQTDFMHNPGKNYRDRDFDGREIGAYDDLFEKLEHKLGYSNNCEFVDLGVPSYFELSRSEIRVLKAAAEKIIRFGGVHIAAGIFLYRGTSLSETQRLRGKIREVVLALSKETGIDYMNKRRLEGTARVMRELGA